MSKLQEHAKRNGGRQTPHEQKHTMTIVACLRTRVERASKSFKRVLEVGHFCHMREKTRVHLSLPFLSLTYLCLSPQTQMRTERLKVAKQRRDEYNGAGFSNSAHGGSTSSMTALLSATAVEEPSRGSGNGNGEVALEIGGTQDMVMYTQRVRFRRGLLFSPTQIALVMVMGQAFSASTHLQDTYVEERAAAMEQVERTISELGTVFQQLAEMIQQQGEKVERIDTNVEQVVRY